MKLHYDIVNGRHHQNVTLSAASLLFLQKGSLLPFVQDRSYNFSTKLAAFECVEMSTNRLVSMCANLILRSVIHFMIRVFHIIGIFFKKTGEVC